MVCLTADDILKFFSLDRIFHDIKGLFLKDIGIEVGGNIHTDGFEIVEGGFSKDLQILRPIDIIVGCLITRKDFKSLIFKISPDARQDNRKILFDRRHRS